MDDTPSSPPLTEDLGSALFAQLVMQQANMAFLLLGRTPHPETGKEVKDLDAAKLFIDQLEMIEAKTKGNLSREEQSLLKQTLMSLHLAFVEAVNSKPEETQETKPPAPSAVGGGVGSAPAGDPEAGKTESGKRFSKSYPD